MADRKTRDGRQERILARPMTVAGAALAPGETVRLRPDQIERLEPEGYFEPPAKPSTAREDKR